MIKVVVNYNVIVTRTLIKFAFNLTMTVCAEHLCTLPGWECCGALEEDLLIRAAIGFEIPVLTQDKTHVKPPAKFTPCFLIPLEPLHMPDFFVYFKQLQVLLFAAFINFTVDVNFLKLV